MCSTININGLINEPAKRESIEKWAEDNEIDIVFFAFDKVLCGFGGNRKILVETVRSALWARIENLNEFPLHLQVPRGAPHAGHVCMHLLRGRSER